MKKSVSEIVEQLKSFNKDDLISVFSKNGGNNSEAGQIQRDINKFDEYEKAYFDKEYDILLSNNEGDNLKTLIIKKRIKSLDKKEFDFFISAGIRCKKIGEQFIIETFGINFTPEYFINVSETDYFKEGSHLKLKDTKTINRIQLLCTSISILDTKDFTSVMDYIKELMNKPKSKK